MSQRTRREAEDTQNGISAYPPPLRVSSATPQLSKKRVEHLLLLNDICMKDFNEVITYLVQLKNNKDSIREIRIKKYENKWKVSVTRQPKTGVGIHDLFW